MGTTVHEIIGVFVAIVVVGGVTAALMSKQVPAAVGAVGGTFYKSLYVAENPGKPLPK